MFSGCSSTPTKLYSGPDRPASETAYLERDSLNDYRTGAIASVKRMNGVHIANKGQSYTLPPGPQKVELVCIRQVKDTWDYGINDVIGHKTFVYTFEAGNKYRPYVASSNGGGNAVIGVWDGNVRQASRCDPALKMLKK